MLEQEKLIQNVFAEKFTICFYSYLFLNDFFSYSLKTIYNAQMLIYKYVCLY